MTAPSGRWLAWVWAMSRLALIAMALVVVLRSETGDTFLGVVSHWDVDHFLGLARDGYQIEGEDANRMAFFPGLPIVLAPFIAIGIPGAVAGLIVSAIASAVAAAALHRLGGFWAAALWLIAPAAVFGFVPYTEALFCAFAFWAWERARADRWAAAALLAAGACTVRVSGLFLIGALGIMILTRPMPDGTTPAARVTGWLHRAVWLLIPAAATFAYFLYLFG
ncbi:MAG: mannosyltransferase family protein, partial [Propionibacteriaceae bacterium]|nr:mannosyltransferase family protein [Propionibacteriaceae bacterium]